MVFGPPALSVTIYDYFSSEKGDLRIKTEALKKVIQQILNGEKMPSLLMVIIKFLMPLDDHTIKKLLLIFWEIVPKTGQDGKLLQEMILVCDAYRKVRASMMKQDIHVHEQNEMTLVIMDCSAHKDFSIHILLF